MKPITSPVDYIPKWGCLCFFFSSCITFGKCVFKEFVHFISTVDFIVLKLFIMFPYSFSICKIYSDFFPSSSDISYFVLFFWSALLFSIYLSFQRAIFWLCYFSLFICLFYILLIFVFYYFFTFTCCGISMSFPFKLLWCKCDLLIFFYSTDF